MAEQITIDGKNVRLESTSRIGGAPTIAVEEFVNGVVDSSVRGMASEPMPDNVKWLVQSHNLSICILQLTPEVRWIKWLAENSPQPFGPEAQYAEYPLATPYVVLKVPLLANRIEQRIEVFYRSQPLESLDGDGGALFWPNLYNVSVNAYRCTAWYCSQHLPETGMRTKLQPALDAVVHHLFGGGFNASSETHEGLSTFGLCVKENVDPRVTNVKRWADASKKDPRFVLDVNWKPTGLTVRSLIERELKFHRLASGPHNVQALGSIVLQRSKPK